MLNIVVDICRVTSLYVIPTIELSLTNKYFEIYFHLIVFDIYFCFHIGKPNESE